MSESPVGPNSIGSSAAVYSDLVAQAFEKAKDAIAKLPPCPG